MNPLSQAPLGTEANVRNVNDFNRRLRTKRPPLVLDDGLDQRAAGYNANVSMFCTAIIPLRSSTAGIIFPALSAALLPADNDHAQGISSSYSIVFDTSSAAKRQASPRHLRCSAAELGPSC
ncbi:hypothetical protein IAT40_002071 [Kwoniella sp. CBS 6097]